MTDPRMTPTSDAPVTVEQCDRERAADAVLQIRGTKDGNWQKRIRHGECDDGVMCQSFARHRLAALASAPAADWDTVRGQTNLSALHHAERLLGADNAVEKIMAQSDEQVVADAMKCMPAEAVKAAIRGWLDADDATHWGAFEAALDAAINETPERARIVAMLRADAEAMRANATAYSEESPTDARALHEVAATLGFKAAQIERGDHLDADTASAPAGDGVEEAVAHLMATRRIGTASLNDHQRDADDAKMREAYRDILTKALPFLARPHSAVAPAGDGDAVSVIRRHAAEAREAAETDVDHPQRAEQHRIFAHALDELAREVSALDRPRAAVGERGAIDAILQITNLDEVQIGQEPRFVLEMAQEALAALQSPPAKVEG